MNSAPTLDVPRPATGPAARASSAPLRTVLTVTWISSMATGIPYNGIFYITKNVYHFSSVASGLLGVLLGITYIVGALGTGPMIRALVARGLVRGERDVLLALAVLMAALCALPLTVFFGLPPERRAAEGAWAVWIYMGAYSALCGGFWPIVESFLSGGRTAAQLRGAIGKFNVTWSSSLIASLWCMVPFDARGQVLALAVCAAAHLLSLAWILRLPIQPGDHPHEDHHVPDSYHVLLPLHRVLMPVVYLVMYALSPVLPTLIASLGVAPRWEPAVGSAWLAARLGMFFLLERWHGWHGRWITATAGLTLLIGGFVLAVASPFIAGGTSGVALLVLGLLLFGSGAASVYCAALYYALEVGAAEVEAGGMHEAMIGLGYTLGPAAGLIPAWIGSIQIPAVEPSRWWMVGLVGTLTAGGVGIATRAAARAKARLASGGDSGGRNRPGSS